MNSFKLRFHSFQKFPARRRPDSSLGFYSLIFIALGLLVVSGCSDLSLENAFDGDYSVQKNNEVIGNYCQSCHIHKDFEAEAHMEARRVEYKRTYFRKAVECRSCHYLEKGWVRNHYLRKTRSPDDANRGLYRKFERKELKEMSKG
jgi:hypothetical protein